MKYIIVFFIIITKVNYCSETTDNEWDDISDDAKAINNELTKEIAQYLDTDPIISDLKITTQNRLTIANEIMQELRNKIDTLDRQDCSDSKNKSNFIKEISRQIQRLYDLSELPKDKRNEYNGYINSVDNYTNGSRSHLLAIIEAYLVIAESTMADFINASKNLELSI
ncbi:hypothetical protein HYV10_00690 [Candidatus Dependentiae bacterium]|nr:hypothetical protein [Candidatus Dependentiae bacterium]